MTQRRVENTSVHFLTFSPVSVKGFDLAWNCSLPSEDVEQGMEGEIKFLNYGNSETLSWTILPECDTIYFQSLMFNLESEFDYLFISSGSQTKNFTGSIIIDFSLEVSEMVLIRFTSDMTVTLDGFILQWSCFSFDQVYSHTFSHLNLKSRDFIRLKYLSRYITIIYRSKPDAPTVINFLLPIYSRISFNKDHLKIQSWLVQNRGLGLFKFITVRILKGCLDPEMKDFIP